jgi:hypothetical protein
MGGAVGTLTHTHTHSLLCLPVCSERFSIRTSPHWNMCVSYRQNCPYACTQGMWRTGYAALPILNLGNRWMWADSCMPLPNIGTIITCWLDGGRRHSRSVRFGEQQNLFIMNEAMTGHLSNQYQSCMVLVNCDGVLDHDILYFQAHQVSEYVCVCTVHCVRHLTWT